MHRLCMLFIKPKTRIGATDVLKEEILKCHIRMQIKLKVLIALIYMYK